MIRIALLLFSTFLFLGSTHAQDEQVANTAVKDWTIAPNPANSTVVVTFGSTTPPDLNSRLFDIFGRMQYREDTPNLSEKLLNTESLPTGVYVLVLTENGKITQQARITIKH